MLKKSVQTANTFAGRLVPLSLIPPGSRDLLQLSTDEGMQKNGNQGLCPQRTPARGAVITQVLFFLVGTETSHNRPRMRRAPSSASASWGTRHELFVQFSKIYTAPRS